jgi:cell division transport system permease protein
MREDVRLHLVAVSSLTVAFLCFAAALWVLGNLSAVADALGRSARMSIYLRDGASPEDIDRLRATLEALPEVRSAEHVTPERAREELARGGDRELATLPANVFPASIEVTLQTGTGTARLAALAQRVERYGAVEDVETYQGFFGRLDTLLTTGRWASTGLGVLVLLCALFVVGSTIRLAIAGRRDEIEVLKLCGASNAFVRGPFLIEGAVQGTLSALLAIALLFAVFIGVRESLDATALGLAGVRTAFLHPAIAIALVAGGGLLGAAGSAMSLRRYLTV